MYSVVLMAALTTAPASQAWHRGRCHGCHGCYSTHGCVAVSCSCNCYGSASYGCYGCYGCYGSMCYSGCYTSGTYGWIGYASPAQCHGCYGCYSGWACYGTPSYQLRIEPAPPSAAPDKGPAPKGGKTLEKAPLPKDKQGQQEQARARVIVDLPADAKLYVDGQLLNTSSARRIFQTPELIAGQLYYYELKAEVIRDGQTIASNQKVILRPGEAATASFADLGQRREATATAGQQ